MTELQAFVAESADRAGAHATAPTLLLQSLAALGRLADTTDRATESGRLPFRTGPDWDHELAGLAYTVYLLADQTGVDLDALVREEASRISDAAAVARAKADAQSDDNRWI